MENGKDGGKVKFHGDMGAPSPWVQRYAPLVEADGHVLDLACGSGRHSQLFAQAGHPVTAIDKDFSRFGDLADDPNITAIEADLEVGNAFPTEPGSFSAVVITNYLWRALFGDIAAALAPGGHLIYETFALGHEKFGRPSNPDFLLKPGELLDMAKDHGLLVLAYEHGEISDPNPAFVQRIVARKA